MGKSFSDRLAWLPIGLFALAIFVSSTTVVRSKDFVRTVSQLWPGGLSESQFAEFWQAWWWLFVKGWHATEFAIVFVLVRLVWRKGKGWQHVAFAAAMAASDEIHQIWVPARGGRVSDWLIDMIGIVLAWGWVNRGGVFATVPKPWQVLGGIAVVAASVGLLWLLASYPF